MGASVSQSYKSVQSISNDVRQSSLSSCINSCSNTRTSLTVSVIDSTLQLLDLSQVCSVVSSSCVLKTDLDSSIENILSSTSKQSQQKEMDLLSIDFGSYNQSIDINQQFRNNISQVMSSTCATTSSNTDINPTIVVQGSNIGTISLYQNGSISKSDCQLTNTAKSVLSNKGTAVGDQSFTGGSLLMFLIYAIIIICIVLGVVYIIIKSKKGSESGGTGETVILGGGSIQASGTATNVAGEAAVEEMEKIELEQKEVIEGEEKNIAQLTEAVQKLSQNVDTPKGEDIKTRDNPTVLTSETEEKKKSNIYEEPLPREQNIYEEPLPRESREGIYGENLLLVDKQQKVSADIPLRKEPNVRYAVDPLGEIPIRSERIVTEQGSRRRSSSPRRRMFRKQLPS